MSLTPEVIEENWKRLLSLVEKLGDRTPATLKMCDDLGERLALCPASGKLSFHLAVPGGLVDHSLRVLSHALTLCKAFNWKLPKESLIIGCLFHDLGKCSQLLPDGSFEDYYTPQESEWHRNKLGEMYKHNENIPYMTVPHRGVWMLQQYGVKLTYDEWLAVVLNDGWILQENKPYCLKEPLLARVVMTADYLATCEEKDAYKALNPAE